MKKAEKKQLKDEVFEALKSIFENVKENKKTLVTGLIEQASFMYVELKELNEIIEKNGIVDNFKQGKQEFTREQPAAKTYGTMIKNYNTTIKQLYEFLPPGEAPKFKDEFEQYKMSKNK